MCRFKGISCIVNIYTLQILIIFLRARFEMGVGRIRWGLGVGFGEATQRKRGYLK